MTTTIINSIGAGKDYATITAWNTATALDLVALDRIYVGEVYDDGLQGPHVSGATTDATHYRILRPNQGAEVGGVEGNGRRVLFNLGSGGIQNEGYSRIEDFEIDGQNSGTQISFLNSPGARISRCIIHSAWGQGVLAYASSPGFIIEDSIFYNIYDGDGNPNAGQAIWDVVTEGDPGTIRRVSTLNAQIRTSGTTVITDTASLGSGVNFLNAVGPGSGNNASTDATAPGTNPHTGLVAADEYTNVVSGSENLTPQAGSTLDTAAVGAWAFAPDAPSALTATAMSPSQIDLAWTDNASNEDGFQVFRAPDVNGAPGAWTFLATTAADIDGYESVGLSEQVTYWYRIRSFNVNGYSAFTAATSATTLSSQVAVTLSFPGTSPGVTVLDARFAQENWATVWPAGDAHADEPEALAADDDGVIYIGNGAGNTDSRPVVRILTSGPPTVENTVLIPDPDAVDVDTSGVTPAVYAGGKAKVYGPLTSWGQVGSDPVWLNLTAATDPRTGNPFPAYPQTNINDLAIDGTHQKLYFTLSYSAGSANKDGSVFEVDMATKAVSLVLTPSAPDTDETSVAVDAATGDVYVVTRNTCGLWRKPWGEAISKIHDFTAAGHTRIPRIAVWLDPDNGKKYVYFPSYTPNGGIHRYEVATDTAEAFASGMTGANAPYDVQPATRSGVDYLFVSCATGHKVLRFGLLYPAAPSGLVATASTSSSIALAWSDNSSNETGFEVQRAPDVSGAPGTWSTVTTTAASVEAYTAVGLMAGQRYWFRVRAVNANGNSAWSNTDDATTPGGDEMAWRTAKLDEAMRFSFSVFDSNGDPVTGLVNANFEKRLTKDGAASAVTVTVTEVSAASAAGVYDAIFTPNAVGDWHLRIRHTTHNKSGWSTDVRVVRADSDDLSLVLALLGENVYLDNCVYDSTTAQLQSGRKRVFDTKTHADAATDGGTGQTGTLATYIITAAFGADGNVDTWKMVRDDTQG